MNTARKAVSRRRRVNLPPTRDYSKLYNTPPITEGLPDTEEFRAACVLYVHHCTYEERNRDAALPSPGFPLPDCLG